MPKVKTKITKTKKTVKKENKSFFQKFDLKESYVSLFLGALVVFAFFIGILTMVSLKSIKPDANKQTSSTHTVLSVPPVLENNSKLIGKKYTVKSGEDLWSISESIYKSGYNWVDIAKANNITNPGLIYTGQELIIPDVAPIIVENETQTAEEKRIQQIGMAQSQGAIFADKYTVQKGDNLWEIAVRSYGDGYRWVDIAKASKLENPSLIFVGNVLKIPRK